MHVKKSDCKYLNYTLSILDIDIKSYSDSLSSIKDGLTGDDSQGGWICMGYSTPLTKCELGSAAASTGLPGLKGKVGTGNIHCLRNSDEKCHAGQIPKGFFFLSSD